MKTRCLTSLVAFAWFICPASAQYHVDQFGNPLPPSDNILIELQVVALPEVVALPLVQELKDPNKAEAAYQQIQKLLIDRTGKLIGWPMVTTRSGVRTVIQGINEFRYVTEYDSGGSRVYLTVPEGKIMKELKEIKGVELTAVPTAFDTRNVGVTLEVEPVTVDGKVIDLNLNPQHVRLKGMNKVSIEHPKTGEKVVVEQPEFDIKSVQTSLRIKSGERRLLGVFKTSEPPDHLELFILKAEVQKGE